MIKVAMLTAATVIGATISTYAQELHPPHYFTREDVNKAAPAERCSTDELVYLAKHSKEPSTVIARVSFDHCYKLWERAAIGIEDTNTGYWWGKALEDFRELWMNEAVDKIVELRAGQ